MRPSTSSRGRCGSGPPTPETLEESRLEEGEAFRVLPRTIHRMQAIADCDVLQFSTPTSTMWFA